jgi:hypothetical protein
MRTRLARAQPEAVASFSQLFLELENLNTRRSGRGAELQLSEQSCANAGVTFSWPALLTLTAPEIPTIPYRLDGALFSLLLPSGAHRPTSLGRAALKIAQVLGNHFNLHEIILICVIGFNFVFQSMVNSLPI